MSGYERERERSTLLSGNTLTLHPYRMPATTRPLLGPCYLEVLTQQTTTSSNCEQLKAHHLPSKLNGLKIRTAAHWGVSSSTLLQPSASQPGISSCCFFNNLLPHWQSASKPKDFFLVLHKFLSNTPETESFIQKTGCKKRLMNDSLTLLYIP